MPERHPLLHHKDGFSENRFGNGMNIRFLQSSFFPVFLIREQNFCFRERKAFSRLGSLHSPSLPHRKKSLFLKSTLSPERTGAKICISFFTIW